MSRLICEATFVKDWTLDVSKIKYKHRGSMWEEIGVELFSERTSWDCGKLRLFRS